ncbi:BglG family transcription antiterminator [Enterococcus eurekensis]|uniref:BglG family transcription antiterminator n=1 Tax=Enterococcus eurekensis TaxID=1159753 RepID=A0ABV9M3F5_9ENTE
MFLSPREKELLTELVNQPNGVSINQMISLLKVSKRTVYREIENLSETLNKIDAHLNKIGRGKYQLLTDEEGLRKIHQALQVENWLEIPTDQRQRLILFELLLTEEPISLNYFLESYLISNTTFYSDIKQLEARLIKSPLKIIRSLGYEIEGSEKYRRLLMASILELEISEYQFFHYEVSTAKQNIFLSFLNQSHIVYVRELLLEELKVAIPQLSDRKLAHLSFVLILTIHRVKKEHLIVEEAYLEALNKEMLNSSKRIFAKLAMETKQLYPVNEIVFFASLLSNFGNSFEEDFFEENFDTELAYQIKQLIEEVSRETEVDFFEDSHLYKMLLTHLSGIFSRVILEEETITNPILERIMQQYEEVARGIRISLPKVFPDLKISEEEIAYMVLHFANSLERSPKTIAIDIAGFSPSGLASTSMLEMKLRCYFPFVDQIHFFSLADLGTVDLENDYDLVVSTALLAGYSGKYQLVSPLLLEDEVNQLKEEFKKISRKQKRGRVRRSVKDIQRPTYEEVRDFMDDVNELLGLFFLTSIDNQASIENIIEQSVAVLPIEIVNNREKIIAKLSKRLKQSPVGIPGTEMALFHAATSGIKFPIFCIIDLEQPVTILGMDRQEMNLQRVLLMLAPKELTATESQLLGKISGSIIMNDLYTEIFRSGNQAIVYQLLSSLLVEEMKA